MLAAEDEVPPTGGVKVLAEEIAAGAIGLLLVGAGEKPDLPAFVKPEGVRGIELAFARGAGGGIQRDADGGLGNEDIAVIDSGLRRGIAS
ncbi:MAG: hypothetical protein BWX86_00855 [Verrucomicrobia bacterium ADurb.Bin122]|nr:MAG: hypothetical protein BWX86_00855 [Verrucomicrobia bacterium ADurb.Bin122]